MFAPNPTPPEIPSWMFLRCFGDHVQTRQGSLSWQHQLTTPGQTCALRSPRPLPRSLYKGWRDASQQPAASSTTGLAGSKGEAGRGDTATASHNHLSALWKPDPGYSNGVNWYRRLPNSRIRMHCDQLKANTQQLNQTLCKPYRKEATMGSKTPRVVIPRQPSGNRTKGTVGGKITARTVQCRATRLFSTEWRCFF